MTTGDRSYVRYALGLLLAVHTINFLDRSVINIVAESIKADLHLLDWQLGAVSGLAFAVLYTFGGFPIARLAERGDRPAIIAGSIAIWSVFTALSGATTSFLQLILARVGVGIGEAGLTPPAHSLISDYVPADRRISAIAFYHMGTPLGGLFGLALGGLVADAFGWRAAFFAAALPGLVAALLVGVTLREPRRALRAAKARIHAASSTFGETLAFIAGKRTYKFIAMAAVAKAYMGYGQAPFLASFFLRNHPHQVAHLARMFGLAFGYNLKSVGFLGLALAATNGLMGAIGSWVGGYIADRFGNRDRRVHMIAPALSTLLAVPIYVAALSVPSASLALTLLLLNGFLGTMYFGPVFGAAQGLVPPHMRATASALLLFFISLVGLGVGPISVGAMSDLIAHVLRLSSGDGLRWALIILVFVGSVPCVAALWAARRSIREDTIS